MYNLMLPDVDRISGSKLCPFLKLRLLEIPSFPQISSTCFDTLSWNFIFDFSFMNWTSDQFWVSSICVNFCRSNAPFQFLELGFTGSTEFSALFSYMLWYIELKFCIWLSCYVLQITFKYHQFSSILIWVMSLLHQEYWTLKEIQLCALYNAQTVPYLGMLWDFAEILNFTLFSKMSFFK